MHETSQTTKIDMDVRTFVGVIVLYAHLFMKNTISHSMTKQKQLVFALAWTIKTNLSPAQISSQQFTVTTMHHPDVFLKWKKKKKDIPAWDPERKRLIEKESLRPGVIDEPSHLYNEIQIQAEIMNRMKEKY